MYNNVLLLVEDALEEGKKQNKRNSVQDTRLERGQGGAMRETRTFFVSSDQRVFEG